MDRPQPIFLDLAPPFSDPENARAVILPGPYDATSTWMKGADRGPQAILAASTHLEQFDVETWTEPYRHGIATLPALEFDGTPVELAEVVAARVQDILERGQIPVVLGGDHSVSIGAIKAAASCCPGITVLQLDAHADTRESYQGSTHNHACVMARAREWCPIVQVGIRSLDAT